ncbi:NAD(P)/FAD-dependent oxidoreductase [Novosphingobium resinovorum]|uniref:Ferredoxin reductase n=1 Tax=Novosphingobium resinovorum TaxID=158500 RepID=A0A1D8AGI1_9SPHN|nr:FAD-dependent oxidoreductase [Novosphingobium resinovorum]AOR81227.1 ferredoxin reductase [Novosphingobium resinovorum]
MTGLVVIGSSYAGVQGALSARDAGFSEPITIVSDEEWLPYQRPPLSKDFLVDLATTEENLVLRDRAFFANKAIDLLLGARAMEIDRRSRKIVLGDRSELVFDKLLIGTGSRARKLPLPGADLEGVRYLRTMQDAIALKTSLRRASEIVVVGGGFIGLEVAASACKLGKRVTVLESASRILERAVSPTVSEYLLNMHLQHGVDIAVGETVVSIDGENGRVASVSGKTRGRIPADLVLIGVGGLPNDQIARNAGLRCTNGIVVDDHGGTSDPDIFAAGDCATHYNTFGRDWLRLESVQNAQDQAKAAGLAIAGNAAPYATVPRFWSDQYDAKLQIVGISHNFDAQAIRGSIGDGKFSVFYYKQGKLIAVDSVSRPGDQMAARRLIAEGISPHPDRIADLSFDLKSVLR